MRYFVTEPVEGGYAFWDVRERDSPIMPNFAVASFSIHMPGAEREARKLCAQLNTDAELS